MGHCKECGQRFEYLTGSGLCDAHAEPIEKTQPKKLSKGALLSRLTKI